MPEKQTLLITRLSAIGDVAMTVPLLKALLDQYPYLELVMLTRPFLHDLFAPLPRIHLPEIDLQGRHKGIKGLWRLTQELQKEYSIDAVVDLHDVLRTKVIRNILKLKGLPVGNIEKDRKARKKLTKQSGKDRTPARHSFDLYSEVFERVGFPIRVHLQHPPAVDFSRYRSPIDLPGLPRPFIGIGPFASKGPKIYPPKRIAETAKTLAQSNKTVFLFGGPADQKWLEDLAQTHPNLHVAPIASLAREMRLIQELDLMVSPDSANGHLARIVGTPTLTIWGPTHPDAGFRPIGPRTEVHHLQVPVSELPCRPCFIVNAKPCYRGDHACMQRIPAQQLEREILALLQSK